MTPIENIKLTYKCHENLKDMDSSKEGFYCSKCNKTVIDFRNKELSKLTESLKNNKVVCGIFHATQTQNRMRVPLIKRWVTSILLALGIGHAQKDLQAQTIKNDSVGYNYSTNSDDLLFLGEVDQTMPVYKYNGEKGLYEFIKTQLKYPADSAEGKVIVRFQVDTSGKTTDIQIIKGLSEMANTEVIRIVRLLEFESATLNGRKVPMHLNLPINFSKSSIR